MHARDLAELAALLAVNAPSLIRGGDSIGPAISEEYWAASKCRLQRWSRVLRQLTAVTTVASLPPTLSWPRVVPVLEEILVTELLTRVWAAIASARDAARNEDELAPVASNVFAGHLDARRQLLALMAAEAVFTSHQARQLDQLRRRIERWTDMLLAHLPRPFALPYAFDTARARDFADDLDHDAVASQSLVTCELMLASLRASFAAGLAERPANTDLNRRIGLAVLHLIPEDASGSAGSAKPCWLARMDRMADETDGLIDELLRLDLRPVEAIE
jgi:hypothetical protein